MRRAAACVALLCAAPTPTGAVSQADWQPLIEKGDYAKAKDLCERWLASEAVSTKVEGHKCLANVELGPPQMKMRAVTDPSDGGTNMVPLAWWSAAATRRAVKHLDRALALAPQDLSIHQGRLSMLMMGELYDEMAVALERSIAVYRGADPVGWWLSFEAELSDGAHQDVAAADKILHVLEKHYPDDHRVVGNRCALLARKGSLKEALPLAQKAARLAPKDPVDSLNLARIADLAGRADLADSAYRKAIPLQTEERARKQATCFYAAFLETKRGDVKRARELRHQGGCGETDWSVKPR